MKLNVRLLNIIKIPWKILKLIAKWFYMLEMLFVYYRPIKKISSLSMLSEDNIVGYKQSKCPVCFSSNIKEFFTLPFGFPEGQNHSFLYFDYNKVNVYEFLKYKKRVDRLMGFFVKVPWLFCADCKNASLGINFNEGHLEKYYSEFYHRARPVHVNRRRTKSLHGKYLALLLDSNSTILEIGAAEGFTASYLHSKGFKVFVSELSEGHKKKLKQTEGLAFVEDIFSLPPGGLDCIFMHHVLEHIINPSEFITNLKSLLKDNGLLFIQVPDLSLQVDMYAKYLKRSSLNFLNHYSLLINDLKYDFQNRDSFPWLEALLNDHLVAYTPEGLKFVLEKCGFRIEKMLQSSKNNVIIDYNKYSWPVDEVTGNTPNSLTVVARKM